MTVGTFSLVALDCPDPAVLAAFYQRLLGGKISPQTASGDWIRLEIDGSSDLGFQCDPDHRPPGWPDGGPQQAHVDIDVEDLDVAEELVLGFGGTKAVHQPRPDRWRVMIDPAGHPFCLVQV